jgi:hypothetical protein
MDAHEALNRLHRVPTPHRAGAAYGKLSACCRTERKRDEEKHTRKQRVHKDSSF